jgi:alanyl-tRNA synthetase
MGGHHAFNYQGQKDIYWKNETVEMHHELLTQDLGVKEELVRYKEGLWSGGGNAGYDVEGTVNGLEISTLVFMMFKVVGDKMEPMPIRIVDTGYGIERWTWLSQGSPSGVHAVYGRLLDKAQSWAGLSPDPWLIGKMAEKSYLLDLNNKVEERRKRSIELGLDPVEVEKIIHSVEGIYAALDHTKALVFILSEGVVPSNVKEGYLCRMLYRRAYRMLRRSYIEDKILDMIDSQVQYWGNDYPQLVRMRDEIVEMCKVEGEKYKDTLSRGRDLVKRQLQRTRKMTHDQLVDLYDSHGLTPEDVSEAAEHEGVKVDVPSDFYQLVSRRHMNAPTKSIVGGKDMTFDIGGLEKTRRLFYEDQHIREFDAKIIDVIDDWVILDNTAFYAEGGGQISDLGKLITKDKVYEVTDVRSIDGVILHRIKTYGLKTGKGVHGEIDWDRRLSLMRAHTATHLIIGSARRVLGEHAWQAGARKGVESSRIDISHYARLTRDQVEKIEQLANQVVREGRFVTCKFMQRDQAEAKYGFRLYQGGAVPGREIRVVDIGDWDVEACGGTHLSNTGEAGLIKILNTERVQDGIERITFSVGPQALAEVQRREALLLDSAELLGAPFDRIKESISNNIETIKQLRGQLETLRLSASKEKAAKLLTNAEEVAGIRLVMYSDNESMDYMIEIGNTLAEKDDSLVAIMLSNRDSKYAIKVGKMALKKGIHAGKMIQDLSKVIGGNGGGQQYFAQGGGGNPAKFHDSTEIMKRAIRSQIS